MDKFTNKSESHTIAKLSDIIKNAKKNNNTSEKVEVEDVDELNETELELEDELGLEDEADAGAEVEDSSNYDDPNF